MKLDYLIASALFVSPACGSQVDTPADGDGSGTDSSESGETAGTGTTDPTLDTGSESPPIPTQCRFNGQVYEDGAEFESPDGCVRYACALGTLEILESQLVTIPGDLTIETQEDVDALTCLSVVEGTMTITGTATDFTPLTQLVRIGGDLVVTASEAISLAGFGVLGEVGQSVTISDNPNLTTMAFQPFMSVFGDATIQNNDALLSLAGAEFIGQCGACSVVDGSIRDFAAALSPLGDTASGGAEPPPGGTTGGNPGDPVVPQGGTFYGSILIADNDLLTDISAMSNLYSAWADVRFQNNAALENVGFLQLTEVQGDFEVSDHPLVATTMAAELAGRINVWGTTTLCGNLNGVACVE